MTALRILITGAFVLTILAAPAMAQEAAKKDAPVATDIEADQMEVVDADKKAIFKGNVNAKRGNVPLKSNELVVAYADVKQADGTTKTDATDIDAKGNVVIVTAK